MSNKIIIPRSAVSDLDARSRARALGLCYEKFSGNKSVKHINEIFILTANYVQKLHTKKKGAEGK